VDERNYEFAMLRTLGYMKKQLLGLLSMQTFVFSLPGTILGVLLMILILSTIKIAIYQLLKFPVQTTIDSITISISIFLGIVLPQLSNLGPIRTAVATSLRDALDIQRKKKPDDLTIQMTKLENLGISPLQTIIGICFSVFGFLLYYFMPLSMFYKIGLIFFFILICILFAMIVGMIFLA